MFLTKMGLSFIILLGVFFLQPFSQVAADEADMQEKYGYYLMDAPSGAKEGFYAETKKKWEDSIYSERSLFLSRWELEQKQDKLRKERLKSELTRQKQAADLKERARALEKQQKLQEQRALEQAKAAEKAQEKVRIKQKHGELFRKMTDLKSKQQSRNSGR